MEVVIDIIRTILILTGAVTWILGGLVVVFYWLCQQPPRD